MIERILGLDISLSSTGFAVIDVNTETCECSVIRIGSTNTTKIKERAGKLALIFEQMKYLVKAYSPDVVVAEQPFSLHNKSTQAIYSAVGVIQMALIRYDIGWFPPKSVKKAVTGMGNASKEDVADVLMQIFENVEFENDDESDALGVVITYVEQSEEFQNGSQNI